MIKDLNIRDVVIPVNVEDGAVTALMETLKELLVVAVGYPWFRSGQQGGEYIGSIDADLSALLQILVVLYSYVETVESAICLDQSVASEVMVQLR